MEEIIMASLPNKELNRLGKQNATANKEWMKRKVRDLDKEIEEYEQKSITDC